METQIQRGCGLDQSGVGARATPHNTQGRQSSMDWVFPNDAGNPCEHGTPLHRVLHPVLATLGLRKTGWRASRRSVAIALSEMKEPVRTAQQVLGHSSPDTMLAFDVKSVEESQRQAINESENAMFPNVPKSKEGSSLNSMKRLAPGPGLEPG